MEFEDPPERAKYLREVASWYLARKIQSWQAHVGTQEGMPEHRENAHKTRQLVLSALRLVFLVAIFGGLIHWMMLAHKQLSLAFLDACYRLRYFATLFLICLEI